MDLNELREKLEGRDSGDERMKMYSVVLYHDGEEKMVFDPVPYQDAYALYEEKAALINAVDKEGNYKHPNKRVSLRAI